MPSSLIVCDNRSMSRTLLLQLPQPPTHAHTRSRARTHMHMYTCTHQQLIPQGVLSLSRSLSRSLALARSFSRSHSRTPLHSLSPQLRHTHWQLVASVVIFATDPPPTLHPPTHIHTPTPTPTPTPPQHTHRPWQSVTSITVLPRVLKSQCPSPCTIHHVLYTMYYTPCTIHHHYSENLFRICSKSSETSVP